MTDDWRKHIKTLDQALDDNWNKALVGDVIDGNYLLELTREEWVPVSVIEQREAQLDNKLYEIYRMLMHFKMNTTGKELRELLQKEILNLEQMRLALQPKQKGENKT